jgi:hypothetical protein
MRNENLQKAWKNTIWQFNEPEPHRANAKNIKASMWRRESPTAPWRTSTEADGTTGGTEKDSPTGIKVF